MRYDILILGGGVAAQQAALEAARLGRRVALIAPASTVPGLEPEEPVLDVLSPADALRRLGEQRPGETPSADALQHELAQIIREESEIVRQHLEWSGVNVLCGEPRLINAHSVEVENRWNYWVLGTDHILVATGTTVRRPAYVPFDGRQVFTPDDVTCLAEVPATLLIVGAGRHGLTAAIGFANLGSRVTLIDRRNMDAVAAASGVRALLDEARAAGVQIRFGVEAIGVDRLAGDRQRVALAEGPAIPCSHILWSTERVGRTSGLNLQVAGIEPDESGRLWCNDLHQTWASHIYAAGEVAGFQPLEDVSDPGLAVIRQIFGTTRIEDDRAVEIDRTELIGT